MDLWRGILSGSVDWITPAIHVYAVIVLFLCVTVYFVHRARLVELARRVSVMSAQIEGVPAHSRPVRLDRLTSLIVHLSEWIARRPEFDIRPVLEFVRRDEAQRGHLAVSGMVNITETMIELFPMLGIFGTVWGISGVRAEDFSSERLLFLFGTATSTTLWALLYVIVFRIGYSAVVQSKVTQLEDQVIRFGDFLTLIEQRSVQAEPVDGDPRAALTLSGKN